MNSCTSIDVTNSRHILWWVLGAALGTGVVIVLLVSPVVHVDRARCEQIQPGMTLAQAERILGGSPGWYDGVRAIETDSPAGKGNRRRWTGSQGAILVELAEEGRVVAATFYPGRVLDQSMLRLAFERLTWNAFGNAYTLRADAMADGAWRTALVVLPLVALMILCRRGVLSRICLLSLVLGLAASAFVFIAVADDVRESAAQIGASFTGMALCLAGSLIAFRRRILRTA